MFRPLIVAIFWCNYNHIQRLSLLPTDPFESGLVSIVYYTQYKIVCMFRLVFTIRQSSDCFRSRLLGISSSCVQIYINVAILWDIASLSLIWTDVSEEHITSVFWVENQPIKKPTCSRWLDSYRLILGPENGGDVFFRNVGSRTNYTALYTRRRQHAKLPLWESQTLDSFI
jgi:hypothetical protein